MCELDLVAEVLAEHRTRDRYLLNGRVLVECRCPWAAEAVDPSDTEAWRRARHAGLRHEAERVLAAQAAAGGVVGADTQTPGEDTPVSVPPRGEE